MIIIHLVPLENSRIRSQVIPDEGKEIRIMVTKNMQNWGVIKFSVTSNFVHYTCSKHVTLCVNSINSRATSFTSRFKGNQSYSALTDGMGYGP